MTDIIERIILFLIASSIIIQMAPTESYKKCMRFFVGLVFLIFVLTTVFEGIEILENMQTEIIDFNREISGESDYENIFNEFYRNLEENGR